MPKQKILILIPLLAIAGLLTYCWGVFLATDTLATWRHYAGLLLFLPLVYLFFKSLPKATVGTGIYLLLATFNLLALTPQIKTSWITLNFSTPVSTPPIQLLSLGLFVLYFILNLNTLIDIQLDYKEAQAQKAQSRKA